MSRWIVVAVCALTALTHSAARADFVLSFDESGFTTNGVFNEVTEFSFEFSVAGPLVAGGVYTNPTLNSFDYVVRGVLASPTPSGFPGFLLIRSMTGAEFYSLSPESGVSFAVSAGADLSDGLQMSELDGAGVVFELNAREFDQNPGRYHPPIFTLNADGTGRLVNADNMSTFNNPPPPTGSGGVVNVAIADEYDIELAFAPSLTIAPPVVPEPTTAVMLGLMGAAMMARKPRRQQSRH